MNIFQIKRDSKMTLSDKISWIGGMMGLFTGFSVISAIEILYWLWFKVLLHEKDHAKVGVGTNVKILNMSKMFSVRWNQKETLKILKQQTLM